MTDNQVEQYYRPAPLGRKTAQHLAKIQQAAMGQLARNQGQLVEQHHQHQLAAGEAAHQVRMATYAANARGHIEAANRYADMVAAITGATCEVSLIKVLMDLEQTNGLPPGTLAHWHQRYR